MTVCLFLLRFIELLLAGFAAWTLAYQLVFFSRLPSILTVIPFSVFFTAMICFFSRRRIGGEEGKRERTGGWFAAGVGGLCLLTGLCAVTVSRPDLDDLDFFHRALIQAERPLRPYAIRDTIHNLPDLAPISLAHDLSSYEPLAALAGQVTGIGPLRFYHNVSAFFAGALFPVIYLLLYRELGAGKRLSLLAVAGALIFLAIDGNLHRSFGNFGLVRCWQGKTILMALLIPLTLLASYRFLREPSGKSFLTVFFCGISAGGLSGSGIFMIPLFLFAISLAYLPAAGLSRANLARAGKLNLAGFYPLAFAALFALDLIPLPADTALWRDPVTWPGVWWENLRLVLGGPRSVLRDLIILLVLPAVTLRKRPAIFIVSLSLFIIVLFTNPLTGPFWIKVLFPGAYWRLAYLFPLPLCAGLFFKCFQTAGRSRLAVIFQYAAAAAVLLVGVRAFRSSAFAGRTSLKAPFASRFFPSQLSLLREAKGRLAGRNLLAPPEAAAAAALTDPTIRLEISRPIITEHIFRNAGWPGEGKRRAAAQELVWKGRRDRESEEAFRESIAKGVDAVIISKKHLPVVRDLLDEESADWIVGGENGYYVILLKRQEPTAGEGR